MKAISSCAITCIVGLSDDESRDMNRKCEEETLTMTYTDNVSGFV